MIANPADVGTHNCGCGCGGACSCENRCCDLQCVVRPNFFCGQTLTDRDLTALVEWARTRFGLVRYRAGWGVVCGLDITCTGPDVDPCCGGDAKGPAIYVNPGYAIDCCGNDLVVCDPLRVDLSSICVELPDPCADLRDLPKAQPGVFDNRIDEGRSDDEIKTLDESVGLDPCAPWKDRASLFAVDLKLRYHEDLFQGQRTMFRNQCSDAQPCGYARLIERPCVHLDVMKDLSGSVADRDAQAWDKEFMDALQAYLAELRAVLQRRDPGDILRWVRQHRPATLCFIEDYLCCVLDDEVAARYKRWSTRVGMWLMLDWILQRLRCECSSCRPDVGVSIGRVLLRRIKVRGGVKCRVTMIDTGPRHRRAVRKACRPLRTGAIDLAPYLWQPADDVRRQLLSQGLRVEDKFELLEDEPEVFTKTVLTAEAGAMVRPFVIDDPLGAQRVAGFLL